MQSLTSFLPSFRMRQNALLPVSCLPPELLLKIFHILAAGFHPYPVTCNLGWIQVTHVCSRWRQTACADATLWTRMDFSMGRWWVCEMAERARSAPHVSIYSPSHNFREDTDFINTVITSHSHRICKLDLMLFSRSQTMQIIQSLPSPIPVLRALNLMLLHETHTDSSPPPQLPERTLCITGLMSLSLHHIVPCWETNNVPNLETLTLRLPSHAGVGGSSESSRPSFAQWESMLSKTPRLRRLDCFLSLPIARRETPPTQPTHSLKLSNLEYLEIFDSMFEVDAFLNLIWIPPACTLGIQCETVYSDPLSLFDSIFFHVSCFWRRGQNHKHTEALVVDFCEELIELRLERESSQASEVQQYISVKLYGTYKQSDLNFFEVLQRITHSLPTSNIVSASFNICDLKPSVTRDYWKLLVRCEAVTNLDVTLYWSISPFLLALAASSSHSEAIDPGTTSSFEPSSSLPHNTPSFLPKLISISLSSGHDDDDFSYDDWEIWHELLYNAMLSRAASGHAIQKLKLDSWQAVTTERIDLLRSVVQDVEVVEPSGDEGV
jgi:hypothetical protein